MKTIFTFLFFLMVFSEASGFGLIEYSTVIHTKHRSRHDTLRNNHQHFGVIETSQFIKKDNDKTPENHFTKSLIQWIANGVKSTLEFITSALISVAKAIIELIIRLFTSKI